MPKIIAVHNPTFNTPHIAIAIATVMRVLIIMLSVGEVKLLGDMYAFGLQGAFVFSSSSLDMIRWQLGRRDAGFWLGVAWGIDLVESSGDLSRRHGHPDRHADCRWRAAGQVSRPACATSRHPAPAARAYGASEDLVEDELKGLMTLTEAVEVKRLYSSSTLLAQRDESPRLIRDGITRAIGASRRSALYHMLRGQVVKGLIKRLTRSCHLVISN